MYGRGRAARLLQPAPEASTRPNEAKGGKRARTDAAAPAPHIGPRRLRLNLAWRTRDRLPRLGRGDPPLDLCRSRRARQTSRECARHARGETRGPRRDACLERLSPSGNLLWRNQLGTRSPHGQSAPLSRPDPIHHASRGRRVCLLRPGFCAAHRGARPTPAACARLGRALRGKPASQDRSSTEFSPTRISSRRLRPITNGRLSTRTRPRRSATPPARPAIRRV